MHGFSFRLLPVAGGVRVTMSGAGQESASWLVPGVRPRLV
jgi:hypothetical protein